MHLRNSLVLLTLFWAGFWFDAQWLRGGREKLSPIDIALLQSVS